MALKAHGALRPWPKGPQASAPTDLDGFSKPKAIKSCQAWPQKAQGALSSPGPGPRAPGQSHPQLLEGFRNQSSPKIASEATKGQGDLSKAYKPKGLKPEP